MERRPDLADARESLEYWERRLAALPRRDRRGRREATEHVERWRRRVNEEERAAYGAGAVGLLAQVAAEGRLPEPVRHGARRVAKAGRRTAKVVVYTTATLSLLVVVVLVALIAALV